MKIIFNYSLLFQELFSAIDWDSSSAPPVGKKVDDYDFGHLIATGCDAAVYEASPVNQPTLDLDEAHPVNQLNLNLDESMESSEEDAPLSFEVISESDEASFEVIPDSGASSLDEMSVSSGGNVVSEEESAGEESNISG